MASSLSYSEWVPSTTSKRTPTIGKPPLSNVNSATNSIPTDVVNSLPTSTPAATTPSKTDKINDLLDKMNAEQHYANAESMSNFEPISPPINIIKIDKKTNAANEPVQPLYGGRAAVYSSYKNVYNAPTELDGYYQSENSSKNSQHMDRYMEKLNYLIHLLEQQQKEQTGGSTEEFILYCLFGVFVIYIVDAFARYGKNTGISSVKPRYKR
jgi:hypothetical protein